MPTIETIGVGGMTVELKQTYDRELLMMAIPEFVHLNWGHKKNIPARGGKSIEFRFMQRLVGTTGALTEGTPPASLQATFANVAATISQYGHYAALSDVLDTQAFDPVAMEYVQNFGQQMGDSLDLVARAVLIAGTTIQYASTAATRTGASGVGSGMFLDGAEIREAVNTLERNNAKPVDSGKWAAIIHPDTKHDLFADPEVAAAMRDAANRGDSNPLFTGQLPDFHGVRFFETTNAMIWASLGLSGADVYATLIFGKQAYGVTELDALQARTVIHPRGSGGHSDPLEQYGTIGWKAALAVVILNQNFMLRIEHNASRVTAA